MRKPVVPAVVLLLLVLAIAFRWTRWEAVVTQSSDITKLSYRVDRWTGQQWIRVIGLNNGQFIALERPAFPYRIALGELKATEQQARDFRKTALIVWYSATFISAAWLTLSLWVARRRREEDLG